MPNNISHQHKKLNRPAALCDTSTLQAISLVEDLLDALPALDITERTYRQLINCYARRLREHSSELEHQIRRDFSHSYGEEQ